LSRAADIDAFFWKLMQPTDPTASPIRKKGRPRRADAPKIPWVTVDKSLVFGEREVDPKTGNERVRYPSLAELAERFGVSRTLMWKYAHKHRVYERRAEVRLKTEARFEDKVIEKLATSRATATVNVIGVVDQFLLRFEQELREGRVKTDSAADFDRLARLRELMNGSSDARIELQGGLTLEAIQARHRALRGQVAQITPQIAGTVEPEAGEPPQPATDRVRVESRTNHLGSRGDAAHAASRQRVEPPADRGPSARGAEEGELVRAIDRLGGPAR
jgi:hypothetical protein